MLKKVLVANRGEIALRVLRACRELGIETVAVYSEADRNAPHVRYADEAYLIGPPPSVESYLRIDRIIDVARRSGSEAIHPGYGFLAENSDFADSVESAGLIFIGPNAASMRLMGDKVAARHTMERASVPVIPGTEPIPDEATGSMWAAELGYPIMLKAPGGGGGKGMRIVRSADELGPALKQAKGEAASAFGNPTIYMEKLLVRPRHIEFQVLADLRGNVVHLGERECSIQRRHQKLIEESPSPIVVPELREKMGEVAVRAAKAAGYTNAGTVEFLVDQDRNFYFLEMNARLQVEHPVTELVTGIDIVHHQLQIASGEPLALKQTDIKFRGAAIECRISAEDPENGFLPSTGTVHRLVEPSGPGVRLESGLCEGCEISVFYDPLVAKLLVWAEDRLCAIARMKRALREYEIGGIATTVPFHRMVMENKRFCEGDYDTAFLDEVLEEHTSVHPHRREAAIAAALYVHREQKRFRPQEAGTTTDENPWKMSGRWAQMRRM
jgi:acetyl-CoA carboxylase biotin carboxylase subunit